ncbi:uncharacterized protein LOC110884226 isoform X3 [Helianthus annuus]|uniref:uncharacterized protein LOC110884226 isoform X3 n=1 Tax=Helianthus annuus TaxID=4232 RepID=UPI000B8FA768|nr:uncharacterized protein LOC110884226 isoform X3 [Helianthus annuus]
MWRSTVFPENENSDQSISEDDDLSEELVEDHVSLGNPAEKKGEVQILSQLDMLRADANEVIHERNQTSLLCTRQIDTCVEDDVEFPNFVNKDEITCILGEASACDSDEEILFKNQGTGDCMQLSTSFTSEADNDNYQNINPFTSGGNRKGVCTWLAENADINVTDNCASFHSLSSKLKRSSKGGQGKAKHKFSIRTLSHNDNLNKDSSDVYESHTSVKEKEMDGMTNSMTPARFPISHTHSSTSVAELLLRVQDEHDLPEGSTINVALYDKTKGQSKERAVKRRVLSTDHSDIDDDPDCLDSDSSEDNEYNHQIQELIMPESKQKTIADQFHEALGAASTNEDDPVYAAPQRTGFGLFGKLKRVMQSEKEKDSIFLNKLCNEEYVLSRHLESDQLQAFMNSDEAGCLDVKILSKTLEGKLTVCLCSSVEDDESSTSIDNNLSIVKRKNTTIIFSSRVCSDVELDVGTLVRIHPPWKEVSIKGKDETAILSTYFSQI